MVRVEGGFPQSGATEVVFKAVVVSVSSRVAAKPTRGVKRYILKRVSVIQPSHHVLRIANPIDGGSLEATLFVFSMEAMSASLGKLSGGGKNL